MMMMMIFSLFVWLWEHCQRLWHVRVLKTIHDGLLFPGEAAANGRKTCQRVRRTNLASVSTLACLIHPPPPPLVGVSSLQLTKWPRKDEGEWNVAMTKRTRWNACAGWWCELCWLSELLFVSLKFHFRFLLKDDLVSDTTPSPEIFLEAPPGKKLPCTHVLIWTQSRTFWFKAAILGQFQISHLLRRTPPQKDLRTKCANSTWYAVTTSLGTPCGYRTVSHRTKY